METKKIKYAAAAIIKNEKGEVLIAKRSSTKFPFPTQWSLPSTAYKKGEDPKNRLKKAVKKKLGLDIKVKEKIGTKKGEQLNYWLKLSDYKAEITKGVPKPNKKDYSKVKYIDFKKYFKGKDISKQGFCIQILSKKL